MSKVGFWYTKEEILQRVEVLLHVAQRNIDMPYNEAPDNGYKCEAVGEELYDDWGVEIEDSICIFPEEVFVAEMYNTDTRQVFTTQRINKDDYQDITTHELLDDAITEAIMLIIEKEILKFTELEAEELASWRKSN